MTLGLGSVASLQPSIALAARTQSARPVGQHSSLFRPRARLDTAFLDRPVHARRSRYCAARSPFDLHGVTRDHALDGIAHTAGLSVVYASDVIPRSGSVVLVNPAITIGAAFEAVLGGLPLDVLIEPNGTIVLSARGAGAAAGASIRVQLSEQLSKLPLEGALVSLLASDGATATEGLTDAHGIRVLSTQAAGEYRVRVRRIGYRPLYLRTGEAGDRRHRADPARDPVGRDRAAGSDLDSQTQGVQARRGGAARVVRGCGIKSGCALSKPVRLTRTDTSVHTLLRNVNRRTSASGDLLGVAGASQSLGRDRPYSARPPADLSANGYVSNQLRPS